MAIPTDRQTFKDWILRKLGYPAIKINVTEEQIQDRIDEAITKWNTFHMDGFEHILYKHAITSTDIANGYLTVPVFINDVVGIMDYPTTSMGDPLFSLNFQLMGGEILNMVQSGLGGQGSIISYVMAKRHLENIHEIFTGKKIIRFNRHSNKLHIDIDWTSARVGDYIVIDCYQAINPDDYPDAWNDQWLRDYATALVKKEWGEILGKFQGIQVIGGLTLNAQRITTEAQTAIDQLDDDLINKWSLPAADMTG